MDLGAKVREFKVPKRLKCANGTEIESFKHGNVWSKIDKKDVEIEFQNVLYTPGVKKIMFKRKLIGLAKRNGGFYEWHVKQKENNPSKSCILRIKKEEENCSRKEERMHR